MHYYQHHIGDFIRDTANLNDHQLATYLRLVWLYYDTETPIAGEFEDIAFAVRSDEKTVRLLLRHYFVEQPDGWHQLRCDRELQEYRTKKEKAAKSANARWKNADALPPHSGRTANGQEFDANQEPRTKNQESSRNTGITDPDDPLFGAGQASPGEDAPEPIPRTSGHLPPCPYQQIVAAYHAKLPMLDRVVVLNPTRKAHIRARWAFMWRSACEGGQPATGAATLALFEKFFEWVGQSKFLTGQAAPPPGRKPFQADLEWLMRESNFTKVYEGKYSD